MAKTVQRIVLVPRYTALAGGSTFRTAPINVREFAQVVLTMWKSNGLGTTAADVSAKLRESTDLGIWRDVATINPTTHDSERTQELDLDFEWVRVEMTVSGSDPGITCWVVGDFVPREL